MIANAVSHSMLTILNNGVMGDVAACQLKVKGFDCSLDINVWLTTSKILSKWVNQ